MNNQAYPSSNFIRFNSAEYEVSDSHKKTGWFQSICCDAKDRLEVDIKCEIWSIFTGILIIMSTIAVFITVDQCVDIYVDEPPDLVLLMATTDFLLLFSNSAPFSCACFLVNASIFTDALFELKTLSIASSICLSLNACGIPPNHFIASFVVVSILFLSLIHISEPTRPY